MFKPVYFDIKELVSPIVYNQWKEQAWMFFEEDILKELDLIRETWGSPIIINNWSSGGGLKQCGLRSNMDDIVRQKNANKQLYLSFHTMGKAIDLHDALGRNQKLWQHCYNLLNKGALKSLKRIEKWESTKTSGGWIHLDSANSNYIIF